MLLRKDIEAQCAYCGHGREAGDNAIICLKRGIVNAWDKCGAFRYDPFRREPPHPPKLKRSSDLAAVAEQFSVTSEASEETAKETLENIMNKQSEL
jgi:hypothetical protein